MYGNRTSKIEHMYNKMSTTCNTLHENKNEKQSPRRVVEFHLTAAPKVSILDYKKKTSNSIN